MRTWRSNLLISRGITGAWAIALALVLNACALMADSDGILVRECVLPADQAGTLLSRWPILPIPIALDSAGQFSSEEAGAIIAAADTWNTFFSGSLGVKVFDYGDAANPRQSSNAAPSTSSLCGYGMVAGTQYTGSVVIYKQGAWPYTGKPDAIALTSTCRGPASPLYKSYMSIMELNYQNFFVAGRKQPDLQSIALHEFGHLLGLNHSCEYPADVKTGIPNCSAPDLNVEYANATLFPSVSFSSSGVGETRRGLNANDQGRANCLYYDIAPNFGGFTN